MNLRIKRKRGGRRTKKTYENGDIAKKAAATRKLTKKELAITLVKGVGLIVISGWLFYRSLPVVLGLLLLLPLYLNYARREFEKEDKRRLNQGFADGLAALSAALEAGYSAENALSESIRDLSLIYREDEPILQEFIYLQRQLRNNRSLEEAFAELAARTKDEDILCFSEVFEIAKRSGGDLIHVIRTTERTIAERAEVRREIQTVISAKRLEANIMNLMPAAIVLYFTLCDPEYLSPLYEGVTGRAVMTVLLAVYTGCVFLSKRITDIKV